MEMFPPSKLLNSNFQQKIQDTAENMLRNRAEQCFKGTSAALTQVRTEIKAKQDCSVKITVTADFDLVDFEYRQTGTAVVSYVKCEPVSAEHVRSFILSRAEQLLAPLCGGMLNSLTVSDPGRLYETLVDRQIRKKKGEFPETPADRFGKRTGQDPGRLIRSAVTTVSQEPVSRLLEQFWSVMSEAEDQAAVPWLHPARKADLDISSSLHRSMDLTLTARLTVSFATSVARLATWNCGNILPVLRTGTPEELYAFVEKQVKDFVSTLEARFIPALPACEVRFPAEDSDIAVLANRRVLKTGNVTLRLDRCGANGGLVDEAAGLYARDPDHLFLGWIPFAKTNRSPFFPLEPEGGDEDGGKPLSLRGQVQFCRWLSDVYESLPAEDFDRPEVDFCMGPLGPYRCTWSEGSVTFSEEDRDRMRRGDRAPAEAALSEFLEVEAESAWMDREQEKILANFNEVEVKILKHVYSGRNSWHPNISRQTILDSYGKHPYLTQAAIGEYPSRLAETSIPLDGFWEDLLRTDTEYNRYGSYTVYRRNDSIPTSLIMELVPRPLGVEDFPDMSAAGREVWLLEKVRACLDGGSSDDAFALLEILQDHMPKTAAVRLLKSEEGQALLRKLTGSDREYARLFLEELPGCRKLTREVLGDPPGDTAEP